MALRFALAAPALLLFLGLFLYPVGRVLLTGLLESAEAGWWRDPFFLHVLRFTYLQALLSAVLSGIVGTAGAVLYADQRFHGRTLFWRLSLVCFALPPILVVLAMVALWGRQGLGSLGFDFYGWPAILLANTFFNYPLFVKMVGTPLAEMERRSEMAALSLGAGRLRCFYSVTLPKLLPALKNAFVLSFLYCSSASFIIILLLGGGPRFTTLEVAVFQAVKMDFDLALAARLAAIQLSVALGLYWFFLRRPAPETARAGGAFTPLYLFRDGRDRMVRGAYFLVLGLLAAAPLGLLVVSGVAGAFTTNWGEVLPPLWTSLVLALGAIAVAVPLAFSLAFFSRYSRVPSLLASLPLSVSTIILTLGFMVGFPDLQYAMRGSLIPIILIQALIALPAVYRPLAEGFSRIPRNLYRASSAMGASPLRVLVSVEIPLLRNSLAVAALLAAAFSLGEVGSVLLFLSEDVANLPLLLYRMMAKYQFAESYTVGTVLLMMMGGIFWGVGKLEK